MSAPFFSVVIPTHNRAGLVTRAIDSVLNQSFDDYEVVVVDDASTDATPGVMADRYGAVDTLHYHRQAPNRGNAAARNLGVREARGRWIAFLDDDDELLPGFLEQTARWLCDGPEEVGLSWCGVQWVREDARGELEIRREEIWRPSYARRRDAYLGFLTHRRVGTGCGLCVRRDVFQRVGSFDESLRSAVDTDFLVRAVREFDFVVIPAVLVRIHEHPGPRVRRNQEARAEAYRTLLRKHASELHDSPQVLATVEAKAGWLSYHAGQRRGGRRLLVRSLRRSFSIKRLGRLALLEVTGRWGPALHVGLSGLLSRLRSR